MATAPGTFFESLVFDSPRPYKSRANRPQACVAELLRLLNDPQHEMTSLHIAGSKGKGSVALYTEKILIAHGFSAGTFTSPHLSNWTERFRINGSDCEEALLAAAVAAIRPKVKKLQQRYPRNPPTFFDVLTACAFYLFREAGVKYAIIEAGIGARLDATRVAPAKVACLTTIELEHTEKLGHSIEDITFEKAGVIRAGHPVVCGNLPKAAQNIIQQTAEENNSPLYRLNRDFWVARDCTKSIVFRNSHFDLPLKSDIREDHIANNVGVAIQSSLLLLGDSVRKSIFPLALSSISLPGRQEFISHTPPILVDSAHTRAAVLALLALLERLSFHELHLLVALTQHKSPTVLSPILQKATSVTVTSVVPERSFPADKLAAHISRANPTVQLTVIHSPDLALDHVCGEIQSSNLLLIAGSVYLAGFARSRLLSRP